MSQRPLQLLHSFLILTLMQQNVTNYNIIKVIAAYNNSHICYESKFCAHSPLGPLLHKNLYWNNVKNSLSKNACYPLERINNKRQQQDLRDAVKIGNHKSDKTNLPILIKMIRAKVSRGVQLRLILFLRYPTHAWHHPTNNNQ